MLIIYLVNLFCACVYFKKVEDKEIFSWKISLNKFSSNHSLCPKISSHT